MKPYYLLICWLSIVTAKVSIIDKWPGNIKVLAKIQITEDMTGSWSVIVKFDQPVEKVQVWLADVVETSSDKLVYTLRNKKWNSNLNSGDDLEIDLIASFNGSQPTDITASFNDAPLPTNEPSVTTPAGSSVRIRGNATVSETWPGSFKGKAVLNVNKELTNGWKLMLKFNKKVESITVWSAKVDTVSKNKKKYTLKNMDWNEDLQACKELVVEFIGPVKDTTPPEIKAILTGTSSGKKQDCKHTTAILKTSTSQTIATTESSTPTMEIKTTTRSPEVTDESTTTVSSPAKETTVTMKTTTSKTTTPTPTGTLPNMKFNYAKVLNMSILFYEAQRSGELPSDNRLSWRGDSALTDGADHGLNLAGGWYDAGDFVKFNFPMASSVTVLTWGLIDYKDAYKATGQLENMYKSIKWPLDYFIKCHTTDNELYGQVGNGGIDHAYFGRPEDMTMSRPSYKIDSSKPGSDLAGETAAAMAAGSIAFKEKDPAYSSTLLSHAKTLFNFADTYRAKYSDSVPDAATYYKSSSYTDELVWAAAWLYNI